MPMAPHWAVAAHLQMVSFGRHDYIMTQVAQSLFVSSLKYIIIRPPPPLIAQLHANMYSDQSMRRLTTADRSCADTARYRCSTTTPPRWRCAGCAGACGRGRPAPRYPYCRPSSLRWPWRPRHADDGDGCRRSDDGVTRGAWAIAPGCRCCCGNGWAWFCTCGWDACARCARTHSRWPGSRRSGCVCWGAWVAGSVAWSGGALGVWNGWVDCCY